MAFLLRPPEYLNKILLLSCLNEKYLLNQTNFLPFCYQYNFALIDVLELILKMIKVLKKIFFTLATLI